MSTGLVTHRACRSGPRSTPALLAAMHRPAASLGSGPTRESKDGSGRLLLGVSHAFERCIGLSTTHQRRPRSSCARSRRARRPFQRSALSACSAQTSDAACFHRSNGLTESTYNRSTSSPRLPFCRIAVDIPEMPPPMIATRILLRRGAIVDFWPSSSWTVYHST